ncbi:MAG: DedA family protein [Pseudomonadota bacterium]
MLDQEAIEALLAFGLIAALLAALLERIVLVIPSYVLFVAMGQMLVDSLADYPLLLVSASIGSTIGSFVWYGLGRYWGDDRSRRQVNRLQKWLPLLNTERYDQLSSKFSQNAGSILFIAQTIPGVRVFVSLPAGVKRVPLKIYSQSVFFGSSVWNGSLILMGALLNTIDMELIPLLLMGISIILVGRFALLTRFRYRAG